MNDLDRLIELEILKMSGEPFWDKLLEPERLHFKVKITQALKNYEYCPHGVWRGDADRKYQCDECAKVWQNEQIVERLRAELVSMEKLCDCGCHSDKVLLQKILGDSK